MKRQAEKVWKVLLRVERDASRWLRGDNTIRPGRVFGFYLQAMAGSIVLDGSPLPPSLAMLFGARRRTDVEMVPAPPRDYAAEREAYGETMQEIRLVAGVTARFLAHKHKFGGVGEKDSPYAGEESAATPVEASSA